MSFQELRRVTFDEVKTLIDQIVKELREAEEMNRGIDLTEFIKEVNKTYTSLNICFDEAQQRGRNKPKEFF